MTVVQLITGRGPTGPAAAAIADAYALNAAGTRTLVVSADEPGISDACAELRIEWRGGLKLGRGASRLLHVPRDIRKLRALAGELGATVVHTHRSDDQLLAAAALRGMKGVRHVRTWHRAPKQTLRLLPRADGFVCVAREHIETLQSYGAKHAAFIPLAVDTDLFVPSAAREAKPVRIAHAGRWKRDKDGRDRGQSAALAMFSALSDTPGWTGCIAGRGEMESSLREEAFEKLKLDPARVEIRKVPQTSATDFAAVLASFDIALVFTPGSDGTSRAAAEFLSCGVALLTADLPGLREFAEQSDAALALPLGDSKSWIHALRTLIADPARLARMKAAARAQALERHALKIRGAALRNFYQTLA